MSAHERLEILKAYEAAVVARFQASGSDDALARACNAARAAHEAGWTTEEIVATWCRVAAACGHEHDPSPMEPLAMLL